MLSLSRRRFPRPAGAAPWLPRHDAPRAAVRRWHRRAQAVLNRRLEDSRGSRETHRPRCCSQLVAYRCATRPCANRERAKLGHQAPTSVIMPPKPHHHRRSAGDSYQPRRRYSPGQAVADGAHGAGARPASARAANAIVEFGLSTPRDGGSSDADAAWAERTPGWITRCQDRWDSRCHTARAHGISVRTDSSGHVPETAENRRRLARAEKALRACSDEAMLSLEDDTLPARWVGEYDEAAALDRAMREHGLTDREREALWQDGVDSVAWLQELRDEDFMEAGIDVNMRRKEREAERRAQSAWERQVQAEQRADPSALNSQEHEYLLHSVILLSAGRFCIGIHFDC